MDHNLSGPHWWKFKLTLIFFITTNCLSKAIYILSNSVWECFSCPYSLLPLDLWIFYVLCESYKKLSHNFNLLPLIIGEIEQLFIHILTVCISSVNYFLSSEFICLFVDYTYSVSYMANLFFLSVVYLLLVLWYVLYLLDAGFKFSHSEVCYSFMTSVFCDVLKGYLLTMRSPN